MNLEKKDLFIDYDIKKNALRSYEIKRIPHKKHKPLEDLKNIVIRLRLSYKDKAILDNLAKKSNMEQAQYLRYLIRKDGIKNE